MARSERRAAEREAVPPRHAGVSPYPLDSPAKRDTGKAAVVGCEPRQLCRDGPRRSTESDGLSSVFLRKLVGSRVAGLSGSPWPGPVWYPDGVPIRRRKRSWSLGALRKASGRGAQSEAESQLSAIPDA